MTIVLAILRFLFSIVVGVLYVIAIYVLSGTLYFKVVRPFCRHMGWIEWLDGEKKATA